MTTPGRLLAADQINNNDEITIILYFFMNISSPSPKVRTVLLMVLYINMHTNQLCQKQFLLSYYEKSICHFSAGGIKSNHTIILTVSLHETVTMAPKAIMN
jgi:hypothetical protein